MPKTGGGGGMSISYERQAVGRLVENFLFRYPAQQSQNALRLYAEFVLSEEAVARIRGIRCAENEGCSVHVFLWQPSSQFWTCDLQ